MLTIKSLVVLALPLLAAANPLAVRTNQSCKSDGDKLHCCNKASSSAAQGLFAIVATLEGLVGSTCSPINVLGAGSNSCTDQTVCCNENSFNGLIVLGCTPINLVL